MAVWLNGHVAKVGPLNMEVQFRSNSSSIIYSQNT